MGGAGVGLAFPYFAVEPDAAELTGNHHALSTVQRGRNRIGIVGVFEPACKALPLGCGVANKADVEASVGGVGLRREGQSRTDQWDCGDLDDREPARDRLTFDTDFQVLRRCIDDDLADQLAGALEAQPARQFRYRLFESAKTNPFDEPPNPPGTAGAKRVIRPSPGTLPTGNEIVEGTVNPERVGDVIGSAE